MLFYRGGTDDAKCDVKNPEVSARSPLDPSAKTQQNVAQSPRKMAHWRAQARVTHFVIIRPGDLKTFLWMNIMATSALSPQ
ncbi:hypothetical protein, partial [Pseudomonas syringae group genomosp. 3]|uniref:hypothetical protein n=1 Tax=Pseudomonas syringae group genomosp. 3 TaxID=251701 RepID=UPI001E54C895